MLFQVVVSGVTNIHFWYFMYSRYCSFVSDQIKYKWFLISFKHTHARARARCLVCAECLFRGEIGCSITCWSDQHPNEFYWHWSLAQRSAWGNHGYSGTAARATADESKINAPFACIPGVYERRFGGKARGVHGGAPLLLFRFVIIFMSYWLLGLLRGERPTVMPQQSHKITVRVMVSRLETSRRGWSEEFFFLLFRLNLLNNPLPHSAPTSRLFKLNLK